MQQCPKCNKIYESTESNFKRHIKNCKGLKKPDRLDCQYCSKYYSNKHNRIKHEKTCVKKDIKDEMITEMKKIIDKIPPKTTIINNNNVNHIHIENLNITKDTDFYKDMIDKMGEEKAVDFIARAALDGNGLRIFEKLYLEDKDENSYPLACREGEIRFKKDDKITSKKAADMANLINEKVVNCILNVSVYIVNKTMSNNETDKGLMFDGIYNLRKIQGTAEKLNLKKELFFNKLTKKIKIRNHPFFLRSVDI